MRKIQQDQEGFSIIEVGLLVVIVAIIGSAGWWVYHSQSSTSKTLNDTAQGVGTAQTTTAKPQTATKPVTSPTDTVTTTNYSFKQLGISMDLESGWQVTASTSKGSLGTDYKWVVSKAGEDGKIEISSITFEGGFEDCGLTPVTVKEVAKTANPKLLLMSWSYVDSKGKTQNHTEIARTDVTALKTSNSESATSIANSTVKPGNYYFCSYFPGPGGDLELNAEKSPNYARLDGIYATVSMNNDYLSPSAQSYDNIRKMLLSIK